jgi:hypothetical protein
VIDVQLADLLGRTGLDVLDHLDRQVTVPVIDGLQAQGDLIVAPLDLLGWTPLDWWQLTAGSRELVRGEAGNNPHTLVADPGTCWMTTSAGDPERLAVAVFRNSAPVWLIHPEHGATGIAPGAWFVRRQRELGTEFRRPVLIAD